MKRMFLLLLVCVLVVVVVTPGSGAARKILAEMFTSTTCAPCYNADNFYFNQWLPNYGGAEQIVTIAYHVWWPSPGNDPMYLANPAPVQTRNTYYQGSGGYAPRMFIDGFIDGGSGYSSWPGAIEGRFLDPSPITITLSGTRTATTLEMQAAIYAEAMVNSSNWRVHWVVIEGELNYPQNSGSGYVPFTHHWVHRGMYIDANGSPISITQGQTVNVVKSIPISSGWTGPNCKVICFVQDNNGKKIQNVELIPCDALAGVGSTDNGIPASFSLSQNFPNPFNPSTTINFGMSKQELVSLRVFNMLGQEIRTLVNSVQDVGYHEATWDGTGNDGREVPSGVYLYQMVAGQFRESRKLMLLR